MQTNLEGTGQGTVVKIHTGTRINDQHAELKLSNFRNSFLEKKKKHTKKLPPKKEMLTAPVLTKNTAVYESLNECVVRSCESQNIKIYEKSLDTCTAVVLLVSSRSGVLHMQKLTFPLLKNPEITNYCSPFKAWSRSECSHTFHPPPEMFSLS